MKKPFIEYEEAADRCEDCGGILVLDPMRGERICTVCGLVAEEGIIDQGPEFRKFDNDLEANKHKDHYGPAGNIMLHDKGLTTDISLSRRDAGGRVIPHRNMGTVYRLRKIQRQVRMSHALDRSIATASNTIMGICSTLHIPRVYAEQASIIYRKALKINLIRGRSITGVAAACIYAVCRMNNTPRTLDEIAEASLLGRKEVGRTYRYIASRLGLKIMPSKPEDYVPRFCSDLGVEIETQQYAMDILKRCNDMEMMAGRGPIGVAASAIYIAAAVCKDGGYTGDEHITQKRVADITGITEVTIRNRYKEMVEVLDIKEFKERNR